MIKKRFLFLAIAIVVGALHTFEVEAVPDSIFGVPFHQSSHGSIGAHVTDFCEKFISVCTCVTVSLCSLTTEMGFADWGSVHFSGDVSKNLGHSRSWIKDGPGPFSTNR